MSKPRPNPVDSLSLHEAVSSTLKRQHILGAVPAAMRFIPLGAFAAKELYDRQMSKLEALPGQDEQILKLESTTMESIGNTSASRLWGCTLCHPTQPRSNSMTINSMFVSTTIHGSRWNTHAFTFEGNGIGAVQLSKV